MKSYSVTVIRKEGIDPISGTTTAQASETLSITAGNEQEAYKQLMARCSLQFMGQDRETLIDGQLYLGNH